VSAVDKLAEWHDSPLQFVRDVFGVEPDDWQIDVLLAVTVNERVAMCACKGPGKTCVLAWICWWFMSTRLEPNIAAVSISGDQLRDGLWKELAKWQLKSEFLRKTFKLTKTRAYALDFPDTWWISARSFSKSADSNQQADSLAGLHSDNIMIVLDEAAGMPNALMATAEAALSSCKDGKIIMAGNPTTTDGPLYNATTVHRSNWHVTNITSDPKDPKRTPRVSAEWAQQQIDMWGEDNPWVLVNIFGKFPPGSINSLLTQSEVEAAQKRVFDPSVLNDAQRRIGVDVARFGDDRTVIYPRAGMVAYPPVTLRNMDSHDVAARVAKEYYEFGAEMVFVDDTGGYGGGVIDCLIRSGISPIPVNFSGKATDPRYYNKRSEIWFLLADWVKRGGVLPRGADIIRELSSVEYGFQNSKFRLEDKNQLKQRLGYSPDMADALAMTFAVAEGSSQSSLYDAYGRLRNKNKRVLFDYDPLSDERMGR
jgi:phage terminase large subunit